MVALAAVVVATLIGQGLRQALAQGSPAFMAHIVPELAASTHPQIRALVAQLAP